MRYFSRTLCTLLLLPVLAGCASIPNMTPVSINDPGLRLARKDQPPCIEQSDFSACAGYVTHRVLDEFGKAQGKTPEDFIHRRLGVAGATFPEDIARNLKANGLYPEVEDLRNKDLSTFAEENVQEQSPAVLAVQFMGNEPKTWYGRKLKAALGWIPRQTIAHYVVVEGITQDKRIVLYDPWKDQKRQGWYSIDPGELKRFTKSPWLMSLLMGRKFNYKAVSASCKGE